MFSFKRFSEQFKIIWMQNAQKQAIILIIISLLYVFFHFKMFNEGRVELYPTFSFWMGFLTVMLIMNSLSVFSVLLHQNSSIHYYMTPASIGEKYAAAWLYSTIFTFVLYVTVISFVHWVSMYLGNTITGRSLPMGFPKLAIIREAFYNIMYVQSLFLLGAVAFRKNPFWKTVLTLILLGIIIGLISAALIRWYILGSDAFNTSDITSYTWNLNVQSMDDLSLPRALGNFKTLITIVVTSIPFICWIAAYFRLKTREV